MSYLDIAAIAWTIICIFGFAVAFIKSNRRSYKNSGMALISLAVGVLMGISYLIKRFF